MQINIQRNSVVVFRNLYDATKDLPSDIRDDIIQKVFAYCFDGVEPSQLTAIEKMVFMLAKPTIDKSIERYDNCVKNGKKGGRPRKTQENR